MKKAFMTPLALLLAALAGAHGASAAEFQVKMLNKGEKGAMVFEPDLVKAAPGDTIKFVSVDPGHNAETIKGMLPEAPRPSRAGPVRTSR